MSERAGTALMATSRSGYKGFVSLGVLVAAAWLPSPAYPALPGKNGRIAFTVNGGSEGSDAPADFWVKTVRADGTKVGKIDISAEGPVAYSPEGQRLAYSHPFKNGLRVVNVDPSKPREFKRITFSASGYDHSPDWSPRGRRIVFTRTYFAGAPRRPSEIWIHDGHGQRRLTKGESPAWSVTGAIAFTRPDSYMYVMRADGSGLRQLSSVPCSEPDWSPDGRRLVCGARTNIATMRADGSGFRQLTRGPDYDEGPVFSPDGRRIAFLRKDSSLRKPPSIHTIGSTGGRLRIVVRPHFERVLGPPDWQRLP